MSANLSPEDRVRVLAGTRIAYRKSLWFGKLACVSVLVAMTFAVPTVLGAAAVGLFGVLFDTAVAGYLGWTLQMSLLAWFLSGFCGCVGALEDVQGVGSGEAVRT